MAAPAAVTAPPPPPATQGEQQAQRLGRLESFYDGLDSVDAKLDENSRGQFQQMVAMSDDPQEARAAAVNKAYIAYTQPKARDAIETQWPFVRQQVAQSLGINKPEVTDTELYGAIGQQVKQQQVHRQLAHELVHSVQQAALEGETDWTKPYAAFLAANKAPDHPLAGMDEFRQMAEGAAVQIGQKAAVIGPAVKALSQFFTEAKADANPLDTEQKRMARESVIDAVMQLPAEDREFAMNLAAQKAARETPETDRGGLEKGGEAFTRGVEGLTLGLRNQAAAALGENGPKGVERRQVLREIFGAYNSTVDPVQGKNLATKGLINLSGMLPQLGLIAQPEVGIPLIYAAAKDQRQGDLEAQGVPAGQAATIGAVQGAVDTALQFVSSKMIFGKTTSAMTGTAAKTTADLLARVGKTAAIESGTLAGVTAAQQVSPLIVRQLASEFGASVPGVDWAKEFDSFKEALPETIATLVPMVMLGTGAATFREAAKFNGYTSDLTNLQAIGFSKEQADKIASMTDPAARAEAIRQQWDQRNLSGEHQADALHELDQQAEAKKEAATATIAKNQDGTFKVTSADGTISFDGITDPAEAQRAADSLTDKDSDPAKAIKALGDALTSVETGEAPKDNGSKGQQLGFVPPGSGALADWAGKAVQRVSEAAHAFIDTPQFAPIKRLMAKWSGALQLNSLNIQRTVAEIKRAVPDPAVREGITAWLQAGGDKATLAMWAKTSTYDPAKRGYEAARKLTPQQIKVAENIRDFYQRMLVQLQAHGLIDHGLDNYVNQMWRKEPPGGGEPQAPTTGKLVTNLKAAKERVFGNYFEGEQAGYKPVTKDIAHLMAIYSNEAAKVLATRQLVADLTKLKGSDNRPLAVPFGAGALTSGDETDPSFIKPGVKPEEAHDYRAFDNPALAKWKWIGEHNGEPAMMEGQLGLHPEAYPYMKAALGKSFLREWYDAKSAGVGEDIVKGLVKFADKGSQEVKRLMLGGISTFHALHEAKRAGGNLVNLFALPELDPSDPELQRAVKSTLVVAGDNDAMQQFEDGLGGHSLLDRVPLIGAVSRAVADFTFHTFIPRLKFKTWQTLNERNTKLYAGDLKAQKVTQEQIDYLTSKQVNARFGHLNYVDMARDPSIKHLMSLGLLAPDFLEANLRNYGQVAQGLVSKQGREPLKAFLVTAASVWTAARIINGLVNEDGDTHPEEPFSVVHGGRRYTMRNEVEDLVKMYNDRRAYISGRESPALGSLLDGLEGRNWRGEKISGMDAFKEFLAKSIPITFRSIPELRHLTESGRNNPISPLEEFLGSQGLQISRHSSISEAYKLAGDYKKTQGIKEDTGVYPTSKFQQLRYALEDGNTKKAAEELQKLRDAGTKNIAHAFKTSLLHPYTGKDGEFEHAFREAQKPADRATIEAADRDRQRIWAAFSELYSEGEPAPKPTASVQMDRGADGRVASVTTDGATKESYDVERDPKTGRITRLIPKAAA